MDYNPFKRKISELNNVPPAKGKFLVSEPFMDDPYFKRSVVLLTEHNKEGSVGFILNQALDIKLSELIEDFPEHDFPVYLGGPVQPQNLFFLHSKGDLIPEAEQVCQDIYWSGNFNILKELIEQGLIQKEEIKFFLGYSGWDYGQLENELKTNSWFIQNSEPSIILNNSSEDLWKTVMTKAEKEVALMANFPENPNLN